MTIRKHGMTETFSVSGADVGYSRPEARDRDDRLPRQLQQSKGYTPGDIVFIVFVVIIVLFAVLTATH